MSSFLVVNPVKFGPNPAAPKENVLITGMAVTATVELADEALIHGLMNQVQRIPRDLAGAKLVTVDLAKEGKAAQKKFEQRGLAVLAADAVSFHDFTNEEGVVERRVAVLYPVSRFRQDELAKTQLLDPLTAAAEADAIELIDLRQFQDEKKFLEGLGSLVFSADGQCVFMARSAVSSPDVLEVLCSEENLNIPPERRFVFSAKVKGAPVQHTNVLGWCGTGICAWAKSLLEFDSDEEKQRFEDHLADTYNEVIELSEEEVLHYAGCAFEAAATKDDRRVLYLSATLREKGQLSDGNKATIMEHYGEKNVIDLYADMVERRCGSSVASIVARSTVHGEVPPNADQPSFLEVVGL